MTTDKIPVIDVSALVDGDGNSSRVATQIESACRESGFFYIVGHGVSESLQQRLEHVSREFFALDLETKMRIRMKLGGRAWRGFFPVGDELTSGKPDQKEGLYFGAELPDDHPKVKAGVPLHGSNLVPDLDGFRETVLEYLQQMTELGHALMRGISLSLGFDSDFLRTELTADPIILFRIFHYPPIPAVEAESMWSVGEHTDYGLLTILKQDQTGGLQVRTKGQWIEAKPIPGSFVCNIGDMLDRMTAGRYRSTPHRVRNRAAVGRYSFPFFFDPGWDAEVKPLVPDAVENTDARWDGADLQSLGGTYGQYLLKKVSRVFPALSDDKLGMG